jgi:hypothetical protein
MFFVGATVFHHFQGLDWLTALLGSVSTVTTIGLLMCDNYYCRSATIRIAG